MNLVNKLKYMNWDKIDKIILRIFAIFCIVCILAAVSIAVLDKIGIIESQYMVIE